VTHTNFGSPRVGTAAFAADFNARVCDSWRLHSRTDVITYVPRSLGYTHVGNGVDLREDGTLRVGLYGEAPSGLDAGGVCADAAVRCILLHMPERVLARRAGTSIRWRTWASASHRAAGVLRCCLGAHLAALTHAALQQPC
jgi:hypothetical protein